jgi:hypothetical protein
MVSNYEAPWFLTLKLESNFLSSNLTFELESNPQAKILFFPLCNSNLHRLDLILQSSSIINT